MGTDLPPPNPPWRLVGRLADLPPCALSGIALEPGRSVVAARIGDRIHVLDALCTHAGAPLAEGRLEGHELVCPWHDGRFDVRDGEPRRPPASIPLRRWRTAVVRGRLWIAPPPDGDLSPPGPSPR